MGDRGNIVCNGVFMYSHWGGYGLKEQLRNALKRGMSRWDDPSYLARLIFCEMVSASDNLLGTTGYGLSTTLCDNERPILFVCCNDKRVYVVSESEFEEDMEGNSLYFDEPPKQENSKKYKDFLNEISHRTWSFENFINLVDASGNEDEDEDEEEGY